MATLVRDTREYREKYVKGMSISLSTADAETAKVICSCDCEYCRDNIEYAQLNGLRVVVARSEGFSRDAVAVITGTKT
jgi:hypothetical protein